MNYDEAIARYKEAISLNPLDGSYAFALGTAFQAKADYKNAVTWYQKAVTLSPENKDFAFALKNAEIKLKEVVVSFPPYKESH